MKVQFLFLPLSFPAFLRIISVRGLLSSIKISIPSIKISNFLDSNSSFEKCENFYQTEIERLVYKKIFVECVIKERERILLFNNIKNMNK